MKGTIKKYDNEFDLLANKTHLETEDFIKNLQRSRKSEANLNLLDPEIVKMKSPLTTPKYSLSMTLWMIFLPD